MDKIKVKDEDFFGGLEGVWLKGERLTPSNIENYDLYKMENESNDKMIVYKMRKKSDLYIVHDLITKDVDWFESLD